MQKRVTEFLLLCSMVCFLAGCGKVTEKNPIEETMIGVAQEQITENEDKIVSEEENKEADYEVVYPMIVTDQVGREVLIEEEPQTIVSGYYISSSLLIALGQEDKIVGVENNPEMRPIYEKSAPHLLDLPQVGTVKELDLEQCAILNPDLLVLPFKLKDTAESLEQLGITVLYVKPESQELLAETIALLGMVTNSKERASRLQAVMLEKEKEMMDLVEASQKPTVYITGNSNFLTTAGYEMYQHSLVEHAGGKNVAEEYAGFSWAEISYEQLLAWDPEYIVLAANAKFDVETVLADENLAQCKAVKNGNVYQFPNEIESWDSPVPGSVLGSLWLANVLHPQEYDISMYETAVDEFYAEFYEF